MEIEVRLFASFRQNRFKRRRRTYPKGTTVHDIVVSLHIPPEEVGVTMLNSRLCSLDAIPAQGDRLAIFPLIGGG